MAFPRPRREPEPERPPTIEPAGDWASHPDAEGFLRGFYEFKEGGGNSRVLPEKVHRRVIGTMASYAELDNRLRVEFIRSQGR